VNRYTKEGLRNCIHFSLYFESVRCICLGFGRDKQVRNFASDFYGDFYTKGLQTVPKPPFFLGTGRREVQIPSLSGQFLP
jgi:hypothetical protein